MSSSSTPVGATFAPSNNARVNKAVAACSTVLKDRLHLGKKLACGKQGCVYKTTAGTGDVVKVSSQRGSYDASAAVWLHEHGYRHTGLPRIHKVYQLNRCAKRAGIHNAYATVREDLHNIPNSALTARAIRLLRSFEDRLFDSWGNVHHARRVLHEFMREKDADLRTIHRSALAWRVFTHIANLQIWLAQKHLTIADIRLSNLGMRKPGLMQSNGHREPYDIVIRDYGYLMPRSAGGKGHKRRFTGSFHRATALGFLGLGVE